MYLDFVLLTGDVGNAGQGFAPHVINVAAGEVMLLHSCRRFDSIYIHVFGCACHVQAFAHTHTMIWIEIVGHIFNAFEMVATKKYKLSYNFLIFM